MLCPMVDKNPLPLWPRMLLSWRLLVALTAVVMAPLQAAAQTPPPPTCQELILDGGFEAGTSWLLEVTPWQGAIVGEGAHSGQQAVFIGLRPEDENVESHSLIQQRVALPAEAATITLSLWLRAPAEADDGDRHYVLFLSEQAELVAVPLFSRITGDEWQEQVFDITALAGQTLDLQIGVSNNGSDQRAALLVDDVSIIACQAAAPGAETPVAPTPTATPSPTSTPELTATAQASQTPTATATAQAGQTPTATATPSATATQRRLATPTPTPPARPPTTSVAQATRVVQRTPTPTNTPTPTVVFDVEPPPQQLPLLESQAAPILIATLLSSVVILAVLAVNTRRPPR